MKPYFEASPGASALFIGTAAVWRIVEFFQGLRHPAGAKGADRGSLVIVVVCVCLGLALAIVGLSMRGAAIGFPALVFTVAMLLMWAGIVLRWWAIATLGRYFTFTVMTSADQPVVTSGPYRWLRHPGYTGLELALIGVGLAFGNWISLVSLSVIPLAGLLARIRVEESALEAAMGDAYRTYASARKRLLPYVW